MTTKTEVLEKLSNAILTYKRNDAIVAANEALEIGVNPIDAINDGLVKGMSIIGEKYGAHEIYLPQVLTAASAMYGGLDVLLPKIPKADLKDSKTCITCVVEGDVHDIGKNIVKTMLTAGGFMVNDIGKDISPEDIAKAVESSKVNVLAMSTLMTPTMDNMKKTIDIMKENGSRGNCTITIGGPPTSPSFAKEIGADHRDANAQNCVGWLKTGKD